ncbi:MAG: STAS domain-containing protein [Ferruginibacter sp.]
MNVKIDTKEKFTVITPEVSILSANMTEELIDLLLSYLPKDIPHIILKMDNVIEMDELAAKKLSLIQQQFYENNHSFVICQLQSAAEQVLKKLDLLELMNITPTESEAWDIVQMEEIERELMGDE